MDAEADARRAEPARSREAVALAGACMSWVLAFAGFAMLVILHEAGHFAAAKAVGMKVEKFYLFFPPKLAIDQAGRDRVRDRRDPARRLREDHRDEPGRGDPGRGRAPRLLRAAGLEADRRDRGGTVREHRDRVRDPVLPRDVARRADASRRVGRDRDDAPPPGSSSQATSWSRSTAYPATSLDSPGADRHATQCAERARRTAAARPRPAATLDDRAQRRGDRLGRSRRSTTRARERFRSGLRAVGASFAVRTSRRPRPRSAPSTSCGRSRPAPSA